MRRYAVYTALCAYVIGIVCAYYLPLIVAFVAVSCAVVLTIHIWHYHVPLVILVTLACMSLGCVRVMFFEFFERDERFDHLVNTEISCDGVVIDAPVIKGEKSFVTVRHQDMNLLVSYSAYQTLSYGDKIECSGILKKSTRTSDWKDKVFYQTSAKTLRIINHHQASTLVEVLYDIKAWFVETLYEVFPSPHGELIAGLTIEGADAISKDLKEEFRRTSLSHIVALSGTNVSIIVEAVFLMLAKFKRRVRFTVGFCFIVLFAIMTGLTSTIIRASLMASISLVAELFHRDYHPLRALTLSSFLMLLWNPLTVMFDISFQLSFMATLSMILVVPLLQYFFIKILSWNLVRETLVTTLSAQVFVVPLILYYSGSLSLIAPISNLLVLPTIPLAMLLGSLSVPLGYLGPLVFLISLPAQIIVSYILWVVHTLSVLPFAAYTIHISIYVLVLMYVAIATTLFFAYKKTGLKPIF